MLSLPWRGVQAWAYHYNGRGGGGFNDILDRFNDEDWDFDDAIKPRAAEVLDIEGLPDYPDEMRDTFEKLLAEHGIPTEKFLPPEV